MTGTDFFSALESYSPSNSPLYHYYFGKVPELLKPDVSPIDKMFRTETDAERYMQFLWMSTPGVRMHTHFDMDYNFFVQIIGTSLPRHFSCPYP